MLGYSDEEFAKLSFTDFTHPDDEEENLRLCDLLVNGRCETFIRTVKGSFRSDAPADHGRGTSLKDCRR